MTKLSDEDIAYKFHLIAANLGIDLSTESEREAAAKAEADAEKQQAKADEKAAKEPASA